MIDQPLTLPNGAILKNRIIKSAMSEALADSRNNPHSTSSIYFTAGVPEARFC